MELKQDFLKNQRDDVRNSTNNDVSADNDSIGENSEQTPLAKALQEDKERSDAKNEGWQNNRPGVTTDNENDQRIESVTPVNDNGLPGPEDDDFGDEDDDDDELIPIETDNDDDYLSDDDDDIEDHAEGSSSGDSHSHIDVSRIVPNEDRPFGRTSGRMIDHEPGTTNNPD